MKKISHLDPRGRADMVDVGPKPATTRRAVASAFVTMKPETLDQLRSQSLDKGDAWAVTRLAGIQGAKLTPQLIPLCHPLPLDQVAVEMEPEAGGVRIFTQVRARAATGVEMEALAGAAVAGLALIDMVKGLDRSAALSALRLEVKEGGRSGRWEREGHRDPFGGEVDSCTGGEGDSSGDSR
jgi:cyclic pyranopterin phosphate synthase